MSYEEWLENTGYTPESTTHQWWKETEKNIDDDLKDSIDFEVDPGINWY
ncbi:hypothetical protein [uncultured Clostridium sp.]|nr:hypothetical protein [uncultured Clostridium sp.]